MNAILLGPLLVVSSVLTPGALPTAAPTAARTVRVFLLAGQSNMEGKGAVNTLEHLGDDPEHGHLLATIRDGEGRWKERDDVWIWYLGRKGPLTVGYGSEGGPHGAKIGPEYGFGMVVGDHFDEPVLLIKTAWGGKDVANDFRSPGKGGPGPFYAKMIEHTREVLASCAELFPELEGGEPVLSGMVWFQGWNDMVDAEKTAAYSENLAQMIRDVRKDLGRPDLPVVIGELGVDGPEATGGIARFRAAQRAVAELPDLKENVAFVETSPYFDLEAHRMYKEDWWKGEDGGRTLEEKEAFYRIASDRPYHYLGSGKIYFLMGHAFGKRMVELLEE